VKLCHSSGRGALEFSPVTETIRTMTIGIPLELSLWDKCSCLWLNPQVGAMLIQNLSSLNGITSTSAFSSAANCETSLPVTGPNDIPNIA
jgi:hypothetical protein